MDISNYYEILGIPHTASKEEIRRAYHSLARKYHPDVAGSEQRYMFDSILQAYGVLSDTSKREDTTVKTLTGSQRQKSNQMPQLKIQLKITMRKTTNKAPLVAPTLKSQTTILQ